MKKISDETKQKFIRLRAEGKTLNQCAKDLGVSANTTYRLNKEFTEQISEEKKNYIKELAEIYGVAKEKRIQSFGETLNKIEDALYKVDFRAIPADKLLRLKLDYMNALQNEIPQNNAFQIDPDADAKEILKAFIELLDRVRQGNISADQTNKEMQILIGLIKAYDVVENQTKMEEIETLIMEYKDAENKPLNANGEKPCTF